MEQAMKTVGLKILASAAGVIIALIILGWVLNFLSTVATTIFVLALLVGVAMLMAKRFRKVRNSG